MNKLSARNLLVAAALFSIAAENAWSEQGASSTPTAPAEQTSPDAGTDPGYAPGQYQGGYDPYWQPPPWPVPPPGYYGHYPAYYPPHPQYRSAPAENPLRAELKQAQGQLAARTAELDKASEQLASLQAEQEAIREVMQQAQAETAKASEQLSVVVEEMDILYEVLSELKARLDVQNTSLQGAVEAGAAGDEEPMRSPAPPSDQPDNAGGEPARVRDDQPAKPEAQ